MSVFLRFTLPGFRPKHFLNTSDLHSVLCLNTFHVDTRIAKMLLMLIPPIKTNKTVNVQPANYCTNNIKCDFNSDQSAKTHFF